VTDTRVLALSGGVGGAKLALGLMHVRPGPELLIVANTGDDFSHLGLTVCPDIDSVTYALAGLNDQDRGWGRKDETWTFMSALAGLGGETWFNLGDGDLAMHVLRSEALRAGRPLSEVTAEICRGLGISARLVPMTDDPVATVVETADGPLAFQHYFVREQCEPAVTGFRFDGIERARPHPDIIAALRDPALEAVVITPSNPFVSIDPILSLPGMRAALAACAAPIVAVSPIVGGQAIKGPAAKMFRELGFAATALDVARHYVGLIDGFVFDTVDAAAEADIRALGFATLATGTVMASLDDRKRLADEVLAFAAGLDGHG
jgi:LPPG:FO 2-phospho-L-lactate transferase